MVLSGKPGLLFIFLCTITSVLAAQVETREASQGFSGLEEEGPWQVREDFPGYLEEIQDPWEILDRALQISGAPEESRRAVRQWWDSLEEDLLTIRESHVDPKDRADALLQFLHDGLFSRYAEPRTRVEDVVLEGQFNCLSGTLVFVALGRRIGLELRGVATPTHAFCALETEEGLVDVETTVRFGVDPGQRRDFTDEFGNLTGFVYVPPSPGAQRRYVNDRELLGLLYQNLMAENQQRGDHVTNMTLALERHLMENSPQTRRGLEDAVRNRVAQLNRSRQYTAAFLFLEESQNLFGPMESLGDVIQAVANNLVVENLRMGNLEAAREVWRLVSARGAWERNNGQRLARDIALLEVRTAVEDLGPREAWSFWENYESREDLNARDRTDMERYLHSRLAIHIQESEGYLAAYQYLDALPAGALDNSLRQLRQTFGHNYTVEMNNRFVEEERAGRREVARQILQEALVHFPSSRLLQENLRRLDSAP